jgi:hypothetical protein
MCILWLVLPHVVAQHFTLCERALLVVVVKCEYKKKQAFLVFSDVTHVVLITRTCTTMIVSGCVQYRVPNTGRSSRVPASDFALPYTPAIYVFRYSCSTYVASSSVTRRNGTFF